MGIMRLMSRTATCCTQVQGCWPDVSGGSGTYFLEALAFVWMKGFAKMKSIDIGTFWVMGRRGVNPKANVSGLNGFCS